MDAAIGFIGAVGLPAVIAAIEAVVPEVLRPVAHELGRLIAAPLARRAISAEAKNRRVQLLEDAMTERLAIALVKGLNDIPPERRVEPPSEVVGPALESLKYVTDEALQDMFVELLLASMDCERQSKTHKAFIKIINEISPYDARLLKYMYTSLFVQLQQDAEAERGMIDTEEVKKKRVFDEYVTMTPSLTFDDFETSVDNLLRLKLLDSWFTVDGNDVMFGTEFGLRFCQTCIK